MSKVKKIDKYLNIIDLIRYALICFVIFSIIFTFFIRIEYVVGDSMDPVLKNGQIVISNAMPWNIHDVDRFDLVVVKSKKNNEYWVKRVIGLANETIEYKDNKLYINGKYVKEDFLDKDVITYDMPKYQIAKDEVFLVGDNRDVSKDSRLVGAFKIDAILSKGVMVIYPLNQIGIR